MNIAFPIFDCVVVGGGPGGSTAAIYLARFRRHVAVLDAGESRALKIEKTRNHPGFEGISGTRLLEKMHKQLDGYHVPFMRARVSHLVQAQGLFGLQYGMGELRARTVVLATGLTDVCPSTTGEQGGAIRYCPVCDGYEATDREVAVVGPLISAAKKALFLRTFTRRLTVFTPEQGEEVQRLREFGISVVTSEVPTIHGDESGVTVTAASGAVRRFDLLYPAMGCQVHSQLALALGAASDAVGALSVDSKQMTSVSGLYAIGDVVSDLHQLSVAEGHAAVAATAIHNALPSNYR